MVQPGHRRLYTAREQVISTEREPPLNTGSPPGTAQSVLNTLVFSTGQTGWPVLNHIFSTGQKHQLVLKIFSLKKIRLLFLLLVPFSLISFFFYHCQLCSVLAVRQEQRKKMSKRRWEENWDQKRNEEQEKLHLDYNIQAKTIKT